MTYKRRAGYFDVSAITLEFVRYQYMTAYLMKKCNVREFFELKKSQCLILPINFF